MDDQMNTSLKRAWQAQIHQLAARNPKLAKQVWQNRQMYFERFTHFYQQLANLPRKFQRKFLKRLATTLIGAALLLALGQALPAQAAVITVDGVVCTLAEAITSANNDNAAGNGCVDGSGADVIDLQTDVTLSAPLPPITSEIVLEGNEHFLDGNGSNRVLKVEATGNLTLNEAIITHGNIYQGGAGILNEGMMTINNSAFEGNQAGYYGKGGGLWNKTNGIVTIYNTTFRGNQAGGGGGIWNDGTMVVNESLLSGNSSLAEFFGGGGGIRNSEIMTLNNTTIHENQAWNGGGIINVDTLTINNSTISGNTAESNGAGISNYYGVVTLNNSTLSGNSAFYQGGGIRNWGGIVLATNATFASNSAYNGGGISNIYDGTVNLSRSLVAGNSAQNGAEINNSAIVNANNLNVIGYSRSHRSVGFMPGATDIIPPGGLKTVVNRNLTDNGGATLTHALVSGSVAIDMAPNEDCAVAPLYGLDQRGYARNVDGNGQLTTNECDAGAFEFIRAISPTPTPQPTRIPAPDTVEDSSLISHQIIPSGAPFFTMVSIFVSLANFLFFRKNRL
ncbi:MAG: hypothetical protein Fur0022_24310 [Anaerolineales bacterium]